MTKKFICYLPEILFISVAFISFIMNRSFYAEIIIITLIIILLLWKNRVYAVILSSVTGMICLYMILALWSELNEFPVKTADYWKMLVVGHLLFISALVCAIFMPKKYLKSKDREIVL